MREYLSVALSAFYMALLSFAIVCFFASIWTLGRVLDVKDRARRWYKNSRGKA